VKANGSRPLDETTGPFRAFVENNLIVELRSLIDKARRQFAKTGETLNDYFARLK
jgi:hypothetical protein